MAKTDLHTPSRSFIHTRAAQWLGIATLSIVAAELSAALYLHLASDGGVATVQTRRSMLAEFESTISAYTPSDIERIRNNWYDPELGFTTKPHVNKKSTNIAGQPYQWTTDAVGSRTHPELKSTSSISTYGDSFTFCDEVNDDQTWPYFLQQETSTRVFNFGVGASGTDQALLRMAANRRNGIDRATTSVLAIYGENINRTESVYLGFYMAGSVIFKPKFIRDGSTWRLLPNPLQQLREVNDLRRAMPQALEHDYWYRAHFPGEPHFPYLRSAIDFVQYQSNLRHAAARQSLWQQSESVERMKHIVQQFVELSRTEHVRPVLLFIPSHADMNELEAGREAFYGPFFQYIQKQHASAGLITIDAAVLRGSVRPFYVAGNRGHATADANRSIAHLVANAIRSK